MDGAGGIDRLGLGGDGPGPRLLGTGGEVGDQAEQLVSGADDPLQSGPFEPQALEELALLVRVLTM